MWCQNNRGLLAYVDRNTNQVEYSTDNAQGTRTLRVPKGLTSLHKIANFFPAFTLCCDHKVAAGANSAAIVAETLGD